jgi:hypothetical protein
MVTIAKSRQRKAARKKHAPTQIEFDYIKSNFFRVISVDGAVGGLGPTGRTLHVAVFSERRPVPQRIVHALSSTGELGDELKEKRQSRTGIVREVEADLSMDLSTAIAIHGWLETKIQEMAKIQGVELKMSRSEIKSD